MRNLRPPSLRLPFDTPPPAARRPELRLRTAAWAQRHQLTGPRGSERLRTSVLLDLPLDMTHGADPGKAAVVLDWFVWMTVLDDRVDNGPWARDGGPAALAEDVARIAAGHPPRAADADPMRLALRDDLWPRTRDLGGRGWGERVARHLLDHLRAQQALAARRPSRRPPLDREAYIPLRRSLFGAEFFFDLLQILDGHDGPPGAALVRAREHAADVLAWTNDVYSLRKDLTLGEEANLVRIVAAERAEGWEQALARTHRMIMSRVADFQRAAARIRDPREQTSVRRLRATIAASEQWHQRASRYHGLPSETGATAGTVPVSPRQPSLLSPDFERDPYPQYARLRRHFPLVYDEPVDAWLLSRYSDVRAALNDARFTSANYGWQLAPMFGETVLQMGGRKHAAHRSYLSPAFRGHALERLAPGIRAVTRALGERISRRLHAGDTVDLAAAFCQELPIRVVVSALGLPEDDVAQVRAWYQRGACVRTNDFGMNRRIIPAR